MLLQVCTAVGTRSERASSGQGSGHTTFVYAAGVACAVLGWPVLGWLGLAGSSRVHRQRERERERYWGDETRGAREK